MSDPVRVGEILGDPATATRKAAEGQARLDQHLETLARLDQHLADRALRFAQQAHADLPNHPQLAAWAAAGYAASLLRVAQTTPHTPTMRGAA
jgi:hypothetical protein